MAGRNRTEWFEVTNSTMVIRKFEASLIDVFNKLPHVKHIMVTTEDDAYKQRLIEDLEVMRSELPRNRWLTLEMGGRLYW